METISLAIDQLVAKRIADVGKDAILSEIEDQKLNYVDDDWDEEFDTLSEAYAEQGRGEAELDICTEHAYAVLGNDVQDDTISAFITEMAHQLEISTN